jgi:type II secretory pathway pseudopilin PulG
MTAQSVKKSPAFTLIEVVVMVVIIAAMIAVIAPMIYVSHKRSRARVVLNDLRALDAALHQYAVDTARNTGFKTDFSDVKKYLPGNTHVFKTGGKDIFGREYGPFTVDTPPKVPAPTYWFFSEVVEEGFWSAYR